MANQKISAMTPAGEITGNELVPIVQGGENRRTTAAAIAQLAQPVEREIIQFACSDLETPLEVAETVGYCRAPRRFRLTDARASLLTASSSGAVIIDVNVDGDSILSTRLTIDEGAKTSVTSQTPHVIAEGDDDIPDDAEITIDIDQAGDGATGLVLTLIGVPLDDAN